MAQFIYNSADIETTGILLFYTNFGYNPTVYQDLLVNTTNIEVAITKVNNLKALHKELTTNILFILQRLAIYYNSKCGIGPILKEGDKVYLLQRNI